MLIQSGSATQMLIDALATTLGSCRLHVAGHSWSEAKTNHRGVLACATPIMKPLIALLTAVVISVSIARAGEVKVKVTITTGPEDEETTIFTPNTPTIYAMFKTKGISSGDKVRGVLMADDVGDAAPAHTKVLEKTLPLDEDTTDGDFNFSKPDKGWPPENITSEFM